MGTTPNYSIPTPNDGDAWNLVTDLDGMANVIDTAVKGVADTAQSNLTGVQTTLQNNIIAARNEGLRTFADAAARDAAIPTPSQGTTIFRNDLGYAETYYALYNVSTNPGGRTAAGWYAIDTGILTTYYADASPAAPAHQASTAVADWYNTPSLSVTKKLQTTKLLLEANVVYSPQAVNNDNNFLYIQINGTDYQLMQFSSGPQYNAQHRYGSLSVSGIPAGSYTAKIRYMTASGQSLYVTTFMKMFIKVTEIY